MPEGRLRAASGRCRKRRKGAFRCRLRRRLRCGQSRRPGVPYQSLVLSHKRICKKYTSDRNRFLPVPIGQGFELPNGDDVDHSLMQFLGDALDDGLRWS